MKSSWSELKNAAILLRKNGNSLRFIEKNLGIPKSTLSGWLKDIRLTENQTISLDRSRLNALVEAKRNNREKINLDRDRQNKQLFNESVKILNDVNLSSNFLLLYIALVSKTDYPSGNIQFESNNYHYLKSIKQVIVGIENIKLHKIKLELKLSSYQSRVKEIDYWCKSLELSPNSISKIGIDNRVRENHQKNEHGICTLYLNDVALSVKLVYLKKLFYDKTIEFMGT